jgi:hypothetical protein
VKTAGPISASLIPLQPETWRLRSMAQCWSLLPVDDLRQQPASGALRPGPVSYCGAGREALPLITFHYQNQLGQFGSALSRLDRQHCVAPRVRFESWTRPLPAAMRTSPARISSSEMCRYVP